jgi:hypothetical protein
VYVCIRLKGEVIGRVCVMEESDEYREIVFNGVEG